MLFPPALCTCPTRATLLVLLLLLLLLMLLLLMLLLLLLLLLLNVKIPRHTLCHATPRARPPTHPL